jgi:hypothetical protein
MIGLAMGLRDSGKPIGERIIFDENTRSGKKHLADCRLDASGNR